MSGTDLADQGNLIKDQNDIAITKSGGEVNGAEFQISSSNRSKLLILDHSSQMTVEDCSDTQMVIGPVAGTAFFANCRNLTVSVCCAQFRTKDCHNCTFYLFCSSEPSIESSSSIIFGPYNIGYPSQDSHFRVASLNAEENYWEEIVDLTPNYETEEQNWSLMSPSLFKSWDEVSSNELQLPVSVVPIPPNYKREEMNDMQDNIVWENQFSDPPMKTDFDAAWGTLQGSSNGMKYEAENGALGMNLEVGEKRENEEEQEIREKREARDRERMNELLLKQDEERKLKEERRQKAMQDLNTWKLNQSKKIESKKKRNKEEEWAFKEARKAQETGNNPWEKVVTNIEIKEGSYPGSKDVGRMRKVIIMRKHDYDEGVKS